MIHAKALMRFLFLFGLCLSVVVITGCKGRAANAQRGDRDRIELEQSVTNNPKPQDVIFKDFEKNWRQFISQSPDIALPVIRKQTPQPVEPIIASDCVFSPDAGGYMPQVTITWNEALSQPTNTPAQARQEGQTAPAALRFDLTLQHNGFARNYYSTALHTDKQKRFSLPSNSGMVKDPEAVLLTGPGLFPKLMDFRTETLQERDTNRPFGRQTLVLRDLSPGLTYTIRTSRRAGNEWNEDKQFVFLTPVCPNSF